MRGRGRSRRRITAPPQTIRAGIEWLHGGEPPVFNGDFVIEMTLQRACRGMLAASTDTSGIGQRRRSQRLEREVAAAQEASYTAHIRPWPFAGGVLLVDELA